MKKKSLTKTLNTPSIIKSIQSVAILAALSFATVSATHAQNATNSDKEQWPCVQRKVLNLSPVAMWDGPAIDGIDDYYKDEAVRKLIPVIISRRVGLEDVEKAIDAYAKSHAEDKRDRALTVLFAGAFDTANRTRRSVIRGIERYQARQQDRADKLQVESTELAALRRDAGKSAEANEAAETAQAKYDWDARVFQERQENIPFACEVPVTIEQRIYALAQAIRARMIN